MEIRRDGETDGQQVNHQVNLVPQPRLLRLIKTCISRMPHILVLAPPKLLTGEPARKS